MKQRINIDQNKYLRLDKRMMEQLIAKSFSKDAFLNYAQNYLEIG